jgi:hypothetical protein
MKWRTDYAVTFSKHKEWRKWECSRKNFIDDNMEVKKQNAQRKEDQIEMEFRAVKRGSTLCTSIRSLTHGASFHLQTRNHAIVYLVWQDLSTVCGLFGCAEKIVHWPVTNGPWLPPQKSMIYSSTFVSIVVILKRYSRVRRFTALKLRMEIIWYETHSKYRTSQGSSTYSVFLGLAFDNFFRD